MKQTTRKNTKNPRKRVGMIVSLVGLFVASLALGLILGGCNKEKEKSATSGDSGTQESWTVDVADINAAYEDGRKFTLKYTSLKEGIQNGEGGYTYFYEKSDEAIDAFLAPMGPASEDGSANANVALIAATYKAWWNKAGETGTGLMDRLHQLDPSYTKPIIEPVDDWHTLVELADGGSYFDKDGNVLDSKATPIASSVARQMYAEIEKVVRHKRFTLEIGIPAEQGAVWVNSYSNGEDMIFGGSVATGTEGLSWIFGLLKDPFGTISPDSSTPASGAIKELIAGNRLGCGNNLRQLAVSETTPPKVEPVTTTKPSTTGKPETTTKPATKETTKPEETTKEETSTTATTAKKKDPTKIPQIKTDTIQGIIDQGKQKSDKVTATKATNQKPTNSIAVPNPRPILDAIAEALAKAGDAPKGNSASPDKTGGSPAAPANGVPVTNSSGNRVTPGISDNGGTLSGGVIE